MIALCVLMLLDYGLSFYSVKAGLTYELNSTFAWAFDHGLILSLLIRLAFMAVVLIPFYLWARRRANYPKLLRLAMALESIVCLLHLQWIVPLVTM